jgi:glycosyltransferase involved in cell wall biosynthesis
MKVLMYCWEFPPHISGGLGVACHGIVHGLLENHIEITLVLPGGEAPAFKFRDLPGLKILQTNSNYPWLGSYTGNTINLKCTTTDDSLHRVSMPKSNAHDLLSAVEQYAAQAENFAKDNPHDVIHAHDWLTILAGIAAKRISHKPLIFHVHSLEVERSAFPVNQMIYDIEKYGLEQCDIVIAVSNLTKNSIIQHYKINPEKILVMHNGLFKEQIRDQHADTLTIPKYKTVLFLGRITHQKGPFHFVEAAHKILRHRDDVQFVMAGDGDLFHRVVERVAELKLGTHIHFTRFLNRGDVESIYKKSQVYVMPSVVEPFGLTCLESLAQHVPVVLSKQSGAAEVIQHTLKVDFWDTDQMAEKIIALLDYPALRLQLLESSAPELHRLLWSQTAKKISHVYERLIGT